MRKEIFILKQRDDPNYGYGGFTDEYRAIYNICKDDLRSIFEFKRPLPSQVCGWLNSKGYKAEVVNDTHPFSSLSAMLIIDDRDYLTILLKY